MLIEKYQNGYDTYIDLKTMQKQLMIKKIHCYYTILLKILHSPIAIK